MAEILGAALGSDLLRSGLLSAGQMDALRAHAASFPAYPLNRLFLEYRLDEGLRLEGYGHGYTLAQFGELVEEGSPLGADRADPLRASLQRDPFLAERGYYVDDRLHGDPEWIEYDWDQDHFASDPAVFFMVPKRLRSFVSHQRLETLRGHLLALPGAPLGEKEVEPDVFAFLASLRERTPASRKDELAIYRLGLSDARAPGWMKLVLNGIDVDAIRGACEQRFGNVLDVFPSVVSLYERFGEEAQVPIIAGSVDSLHGVVHGVDVECPYFHGIGDPVVRRQAVAAFADQLVKDEVLPSAVAALMKEGAYAEFQSEDQEALLTLNHMKFGIAGATRGRVKLYFELMTRRREP